MASEHDMKDAQSTYAGMISFLKWLTIVSAALVALVVILLT